MWVLKLGGHLLESPASVMNALFDVLARISRDHRVLAAVGGGIYADCVRRLDARYSLGKRGAHWTAILATHLSSCRLGAMRPDLFLPVDSLSKLPRHRVPILLPYWLLRQSPLPETWDVTSDSIAAWVAHRLRANLVLIKAVDGVLDRYPGGRLLPEIRTHELSRLPSSPADPYLPTFLEAHGMDAWITNGLHPERLESIVNGKPTISTHILSERVVV